MSMTPAFSPGPWITHGALVGSPRRCTFEDLYEQCSFHIAEKMPSSVKRRLAPDQIEDALVLVGLEAVFGDQFGRDFRFVAHDRMSAAITSRRLAEMRRSARRTGRGRRCEPIAAST